MTGALRIAVAGLGTVGAGVVRLLADNADLLTRRCGRELALVAVSARDRGRDRGVPLDGVAWFEDAVAMAREAPADVVVEVIGGADGVAREAVEAAIASGRAVVTANKALLALHGGSLARAAEGAGVALNFEAAVAGGVPIVKALREGLAANRIGRIYGVLNGTCNFILTAMQESGRTFDDVLAEAQRLGYAEADPEFDIDGIDAAHKLAILASLAFGTEVDFEHVHIEGIRHVSPLDIAYAEELGYRIKLLGSARITEHGLEQRVHPAMVSLDAPIAHVEGVLNAVVATGDFAEDTVYEGLGAGAYYVRLVVRDRPGVFADIAIALRDAEVSIESAIQRGRAPGEAVSLVLTTHDTEEARMTRAIARIAKLETVLESPRLIRIEPF